LAWRVEREIEHQRNGGFGYMALKMNALIDPKFTDLLYAASRAGVRIDLQVRGICCLRPGVSGMSDNIRVTSIVGRFLEHTRIYHFHNGGDFEILLGSADLRTRNLDKRVEVVFPIEDRELRTKIRDVILAAHLRDTAKGRLMLPDGSYRRLDSEVTGEPFNSQEHLIANRGLWWKGVSAAGPAGSSEPT